MRALYRHQTVSRFLSRPAPETPEASQAANSLSASAYHRRLESRISLNQPQHLVLVFAGEWRQRLQRLAYPDLDPTSQRLKRLRPAAVAPELIVVQAQLEHIQAISRNQGHDHSRASPPEPYSRIGRAAQKSCHHVERRRQQSLRNQLRSPGLTDLVVRNSELADIKRL